MFTLHVCAGGQEEFVALVGDPVGSRAAAPPALGKDEQARRFQRAGALAAKYRAEPLL
jgi:hypothetical protein